MRGEKGPAALRYCCAAAWGYWPRLLTVCKISLCASLRDVLLWRLAVKQQVKLSSWGEVVGVPAACDAQSSCQHVAS